MDQSSVNISLYLLFHVRIIYNESSQKPVACPSLNAWALVKRGDNQLQAVAAQQPQQPLMSSADVSALGAQRNFIGFSSLSGKIARTVKKWEIYRPAHISKLGGILCPVKGI